MTSQSYIFFDVDDTLVEWTTSWTATFAEVARQAGVEASLQQAEEALTIAFTTLYADFIRRRTPHTDLRDFWVAYDAEVLALMGVKEDLIRHSEQVVARLHTPDAIRLYPEVSQMLALLASNGAQLGIVTSRPLAGPDLEHLGVHHYFHPVIDAFGARGVKTDGHMFQQAARTAAAAGRLGWHVGDSYSDDVQAAAEAGLQTVLVDRRNAHPDADCHRVADLRALPDIIAGHMEMP